MDVHPTKNVSIGIDPYPDEYCETNIEVEHLISQQEKSCVGFQSHSGRLWRFNTLEKSNHQVVRTNLSSKISEGERSKSSSA